MERGFTETIVGHLADQARRTANAAKAGRVVNSDGEPGVLDLTPLRELLSELVEELQQAEAAGPDSQRAAAGRRHHRFANA